MGGEKVMIDKCDECTKWELRCELNGTMRKECKTHNYILFRAKSAQSTKLPDDTYYRGCRKRRGAKKKRRASPNDNGFQQGALETLHSIRPLGDRDRRCAD